MRQHTILVIEDDPYLLDSIRELLELSGYRAITAANGRVGLEVLRGLDTLPDLILCDIMMPELNGYDVLREIQTHADWRRIPFVFLSVRSTPDDLRRAMLLGANDFVVKPFDAEELLATIDTNLRRFADYSLDRLAGANAGPSAGESSCEEIVIGANEETPPEPPAAEPEPPAPEPEPPMPDWLADSDDIYLPSFMGRVPDTDALPQAPPMPDEEEDWTGSMAPVAPLREDETTQPVALPEPEEEEESTGAMAPVLRPVPTQDLETKGELTPEELAALEDRLRQYELENQVSYLEEPAQEQIEQIRQRDRHEERRGKPVEEQPFFSAFYPAAIQPKQAYALMVFAHTEAAYAQVSSVAAGYSGMMGGQPTDKTVAARLQVAIGRLLTFVPQVDGITFNPAEITVTWQPPYQAATFLFNAPDQPEMLLEGRVLVYQGPLVAGEIPLRLSLRSRVDQPMPSGKVVGSFTRFDPVFASYSHRDAPVMEYFRQERASLGQKMLVDIYDLRAGERWADRLLEMIEESVFFQLFWSRHSAQSPYCRQEWEYALRYLPARPRFIQPVWWEAPMPPPPPELADLHFQRVPIPPLTRAQLVAARLRGLFGKG